MADQGLSPLFTTQFNTQLRLKLQQRGTMLRGKVEEGMQKGAKMASPINLLGAVQMQSPAGRNSPKQSTPNSYSRRWVMPIDKEADQFVDSFDQLKTPIMPNAQLVQAAASACAREFDDEIIRAATAASYIGVDAGGLSTEAFDTASHRVAVDYGASASVGLSVAKLNEARRIMEKYHNTEEMNSSGATLVIGSQQHADLRNQAQVTSSDFNQQGGVLVNGNVSRFMGFDIVVSERLPIVSSNVRGCLAFVRSGIYLGIWEDIKTEVFRRPDLASNPFDISTMISYGATRTEAGKVIQILAADTTGADITF